MGYTAGTLELSILGNSNSAITSIDKTVKSLNSLYSIIGSNKLSQGAGKLSEGLKKLSDIGNSIDLSGFERFSVIGNAAKHLNSVSNAVKNLNSSQTVFATKQLANLFEKISQSTRMIDEGSLLTLGSVAKSLSSISSISKLNKIDFDKTARGFTQISEAINPFIEKVKSAETSLNSLYKTMKLVSNTKVNVDVNYNDEYSKESYNYESGESSTQNRTTGIKAGRVFAIVTTVFTLLTSLSRRMGQSLAEIVQKGADFGETLNLWSVSMGNEFLPKAEKFVNKLNEAYGISKQTLMNSQAIFKNMLGALGELTNAQAYAISEGVTQMALDYASLYNVTFDNAMKKFQAALSGQVRPIRSVSGYDITETTLFEVYKKLGGTKTMRQLTQTEKRLLSIYAIFQQMDRTDAIGDLDRTIDRFANQSRVMADAWKDVQAYAGLAFARILEDAEVMKYINAVLIFFGRILEGLATSLDTGLGDSAGVFEETENAINSTTDAVENLQSSLLDFDDFRALDNGLGDQNPLGIDQNILDAMTQYDSILEDAQLAARKLADAWLESLGFVDANNDGILDMEDGVNTIANVIKDIDWTSAGEKFSEALIQGFDYMINWLANHDWEATTKRIVNFIDGSRIGEVIIKTLKLGDEIIKATIRSIWASIKETDWMDVLYEILYLVSNLLINLVRLLFSKFQILGDLVAAYLKQLLSYVTDGFDVVDKASKIAGKIPAMAEGGLPDKGTMFVAGEAGAEMVYNMPSGQSGVANIQQIAQATYSGTMRALSDWWGGSGAKGDIPQLKEANPHGLYQTVTSEAKLNGNTWALA